MSVLKSHGLNRHVPKPQGQKKAYLAQVFIIKLKDREFHPFTLAKNFKITSSDVIVVVPANQSAYTGSEIAP